MRKDRIKDTSYIFTCIDKYYIKSIFYIVYYIFIYISKDYLKNNLIKCSKFYFKDIFYNVFYIFIYIDKDYIKDIFYIFIYILALKENQIISYNRQSILHVCY